MKEDPVLGKQDFLGRSNETWLGVVGRVQDFPGHLVGGSDDDEAVKKKGFSGRSMKSNVRGREIRCCVLVRLAQVRSRIK